MKKHFVVNTGRQKCTIVIDDKIFVGYPDNKITNTIPSLNRFVGRHVVRLFEYLENNYPDFTIIPVQENART